MVGKISEITIITSQGVRIYKKGEQFDFCTEQKEQDGVSYYLYLNNEIVIWIHSKVPVIIEFESRKTFSSENPALKVNTNAIETKIHRGYP